MAYKNQKPATGTRDETQVPTPNGMRRVNDLVTGDILLNKNGKPCKILKVYHQASAAQTESR